MRTSTRRGISYPLADRSDPADVPTHLANIVNALDLDTPFYSGTFAAIPAVGSVVQGSWYWATDQSQLYQNNGTTWGAVLTGSTIGLTGDITARSGTGTAVKIGNAGPASQSGISFSNAEDYLYRDAANSVTLQGNTQITFKIGTTAQSGILNLMGQTAAGLRLQSFVASETNPRFSLQTDGKQAWGAGGASATDTNFYRVAASHLRTDGTFSLMPAASNTMAIGTILVADTNWRWNVDASGLMQWGSGAAAQDTTLQRLAAGVLQLGTTTQAGRFAVIAASTAGLLYSGSVTTDSVARYAVLGDGTIQWGPGNAASDVNLYRRSAGNLETSGSFYVDGNVIVSQGGSGSLYIGPLLDAYFNRTNIGQISVQAKLIEGLPTFPTLSVPATFTPDVSTGLNQRVVVNAGGALALTIAAPLHPPSGTQACFLVIHIANTQGAATITLTWNAAYVAGNALTLPTGLGNGKTIEVLFVWDGANWRIIASS